MMVKICGIKSKQNIQMLDEMNIDMVGLNFYPPSVRYIDEQSLSRHFDKLPSNIKKVGVFVNASEIEIKNQIRDFHLDYIQLHGDEDAEFCAHIASFIPIIKVFRIASDFDFAILSEFECSSYFLFDTRTADYGGSGRKFDWSILNQYKGTIPFILSGGIGPSDLDSLGKFEHPQFAGIDINSKFETSPGIKSARLINPFLKQLKKQ